MGGNKLHSDEVVQQAVQEWLHRQPQEFFSRGIHEPCECWRAYIGQNGDYVEKRYNYVLLSFNKLNLKINLCFHSTHPN
jgi:hypothetical protein